MKRWIAYLAVLQLIGLLLCHTFSVYGGVIVPSSPQTVKEYSESELAEKFNDILDKRLSGKNVCLSVSAAHQLDAFMRQGAANLVHDKAFNRIPEAERNIRVFAASLLKEGKGRSGRIRITSGVVLIALMPKPHGKIPSLGGLCPLFPFCR